MRIASLEDLIEMKRAAGRPQDVLDIEYLEVARSRIRGARRKPNAQWPFLQPGTRLIDKGTEAVVRFGYRRDDHQAMKDPTIGSATARLSGALQRHAWPRSRAPALR